MTQTTFGKGSIAAYNATSVEGWLDFCGRTYSAAGYFSGPRKTVARCVIAVVLRRNLLGLSAKLFLIAAEDTLQALADAAFMRMLRQESPSRLPDFAGQRVRLASLIVEFADGTPLRVVHRTFSMLDIHNDGLLDVARLNQQQLARMPDLLATGPQSSTTGAPVVDAANRFIARGGSWQPDDLLLRRMDAAALEHLPCRRVRVLP